MCDLMWWMTVENERRLLFWMSCVIIIVGLLSLVGNIPASYGRYSSPAWGRLIDARFTWFMQELPSFLVPVALWLCSDVTPMLPNRLLLGAFIVHYFHRSLVYPVLMKKGQPTPVGVFLMAAVFCLCIGYMQARYLLFAVYPDSWVTSPTFLCGMFLFTLGMAVNMHSDHTLISLRRSSDDVADAVYRIPEGGMFEYVSCANYLGEMVEWLGFAVACWSLPAAAFAVLTICNLGPRALHYHRYNLLLLLLLLLATTVTTNTIAINTSTSFLQLLHSMLGPQGQTFGSSFIMIHCRSGK